MKKITVRKVRVLKPWAQNTLEFISIALFLFVGCVNDYEWSAIPLFVGIFAVLLLNIVILGLYGRYDTRRN